jgi:hypothetical protein
MGLLAQTEVTEAVKIAFKLITAIGLVRQLVHPLLSVTIKIGLYFPEIYKWVGL